ncbi:hypothetical protein BDF19DRAFT_496008 [Syncephalis fuscata]|nr:hypothetical protein BDF19DRAFT_496008 [Syncephalis fuscata]
MSVIPEAADTQAIDWLVYQLADSLLPTGGFVCSSGLEAAAQHGWVKNEPSLINWCEASLAACARTSLPFLDEAYRLAMGQSDVPSIASSSATYSWCAGHWWDDIDGTESTELKAASAAAVLPASSVISSKVWTRLIELDDRCDACLTTTVARKSSQTQGRALMTAYVRCFSDTTPRHADGPKAGQRLLLHAEQVASQFLNAVRLGHVFGHLSITFGLSCAAMGVQLDRTRHLFLFLYTRNLFSSAVRLNLVGPYRAQRLLYQLSLKATKAIQKHMHQAQGASAAGESAVTATAQIAPLLDLFQGAHDRLYSRLFHS